MPGRLGQFGLWLSLRNGGDRRAIAPMPATKGPVLILFADQNNRKAAGQVAAALTLLCPDLHILELDQADNQAAQTNRNAMRQLFEQARPFALLILGAELPAALIVAATDTGVPIVAGNLHLDVRSPRLSLKRAVERNLLSRMRRIFVTDEASLSSARHAKAAPGKVSLAGPVTELYGPLPCNEAERAGLAALINGRHTWFAASVPQQEEQAVIDAHLAALRQTHLALLLLVPARPERADILAKQFEAHDLIVARRNLDEEPTQEVQVLIADSFAEMGLWYRLAPVTFMGGTLSGDDSATRHPFEPASLGSAVIHGPKKWRFATEWRQLDGGGACRQVSGGAQLATTIAELSQPDLAAGLAAKAWEISTNGAGVAMEIASEVLSGRVQGGT